MFGRNVDRLIGYSFNISSTSVGVFSLVGMLAEFGTWGGMLIGYGR